MDGKPIIQQFQDDLQNVVAKYMDSGLELGSAIGTIEIVKLSLLPQDDDDEGEDWLN